MHYNLALIGFGGVNRALVDLILKKRDYLNQECDLSFSVVGVSDLFYGSAFDPKGLSLSELSELESEKGALAALPGGRVEPDNVNLIRDANTDIVVEATFTDPATGQPAVEHCLAALASGKHAVTTNKGPVALRLGELQTSAAKHNALIEYEGTVMSGTPVLRFAKTNLKGCRIDGFKGILNGTANYVLGRIEAGSSMQEAIQEAQALGYAEADPTADIEGHDVMLKVTILANMLFEADIRPDAVHRSGISDLDESEIRSAAEQGKHWKLIGRAVREADGSVVASVAPMCLPPSDVLAGISGPVNALSLETDLLGDVVVSGPGAGKTETAYALLSDIFAIDAKLRPGGK